MEWGKMSREAGLLLKLVMTCKVNCHSYPIGLNLSSRTTFNYKGSWVMLFVPGSFGLNFSSPAIGERDNRFWWLVRSFCHMSHQTERDITTSYNKINAIWSYSQQIFIKCLLCHIYFLTCVRKMVLIYCEWNHAILPTHIPLLKDFCSFRKLKTRQGFLSSYCRNNTHTCWIPPAGTMVVLRTSTPKSGLDVGLIHHNLLVAWLCKRRKDFSEDDIRSLRLNSTSKVGCFSKIIKATKRAYFAVNPLI